MPRARDHRITPVAVASEPEVDRVDGGVGWPGWVPVVLWVTLALTLVAHLYGLYKLGEPGASEWFPNSDKVLHFLGFAAPTAVAVSLARRWWPAVLFAAHAVVSELVQAWLLPGRDGDVLDVLADLTGVLAAVGFCWWLQRRASATADSNPT